MGGKYFKVSSSLSSTVHTTFSRTSPSFKFASSQSLQQDRNVLGHVMSTSQIQHAKRDCFLELQKVTWCKLQWEELTASIKATALSTLSERLIFNYYY